MAHPFDMLKTFLKNSSAVEILLQVLWTMMISFSLIFIQSIQKCINRNQKSQRDEIPFLTLASVALVDSEEWDLKASICMMMISSVVDLDQVGYQEEQHRSRHQLSLRMVRKSQKLRKHTLILTEIEKLR
jgi:hypothetical protein